MEEEYTIYRGVKLRYNKEKDWIEMFAHGKFMKWVYFAKTWDEAHAIIDSGLS